MNLNLWMELRFKKNKQKNYMIWEGVNIYPHNPLYQNRYAKVVLFQILKNLIGKFLPLINQEETPKILRKQVKL